MDPDAGRCVRNRDRKTDLWRPWPELHEPGTGSKMLPADFLRRQDVFLHPGWRNHRYSSERDEDCMEGRRVQPGRRPYGYVHR